MSDREPTAKRSAWVLIYVISGLIYLCMMCGCRENGRIRRSHVEIKVMSTSGLTWDYVSIPSDTVRLFDIRMREL